MKRKEKKDANKSVVPETPEKVKSKSMHFNVIINIYIAFDLFIE